jgi:hypothetical protein
MIRDCLPGLLGGLVFGLAVFLLAELFRVTILLAAGLGIIPVGLAVFAHLSVLLPALLVFARMFLRSKHVTLRLNNAFANIGGTAVLMVVVLAFNSAFPGIIFFRHGFEWKVRRSVEYAELQTWAENMLTSTNDIDRETNIRLKLEEMPRSLRAIRKTSNPGGTVVLLSDEDRKLFIVVKWREAFLEFGLHLTRTGNTDVDRDPRFRKLAPGIYTFYE